LGEAAAATMAVVMVVMTAVTTEAVQVVQHLFMANAEAVASVGARRALKGLLANSATVGAVWTFFSWNGC
jgi:hypothetical protein